MEFHGVSREAPVANRQIVATQSKAAQWLSRALGPLTTGRRSDGLRVLLYHSVGKGLPEPASGLSVPAERFQEQMRWLQSESGCEVVSLEDGAHRMAAGSRASLVAVTFDDGFRDNLLVAAPTLSSLRIPFTVFVTAEHVERAEMGESRYLGVKELQDLVRVDGGSVGAHGYTHRPLTRLMNGELEHEMLGAKQYLENIVGRPVTAISYPHGAVNDRVRRAAFSSGFRLGATSFVGLNRRGTPPLMIRRTEILGDDGLQEFQLKVQGGYDWYGVKQRLYWPIPAP